MKTFATRHVKALVVAVVASCAAAAPSVASAKPFLDRFSTISTLATTVPASGPAQGDQNPYGVAVVKRSVGDLIRGDVLVTRLSHFEGVSGVRARRWGRARAAVSGLVG